MYTAYMIQYVCIHTYIHIHTYIQTHKHTNKHTNIQTSKQANKQTSKQANRQTDKQTNRQTDKQTNRQTDKQTNRQTDKQADRQTDKQTNKHSYIHTYVRTYIHTYIYFLNDISCLLRKALVTCMSPSTSHCPPVCCHEETHPFYHFLPFSTFLCCCHLSSTWLHNLFIPFPETPPQVHKLVPCQGLTTGKSQSSRPGLEAVFSANLPWFLDLSHSMEHRDRRRRSTQQFQQPRPRDFCALGSALDLDFESQVTGLQRKLCLNYLGNSQNKAFALHMFISEGKCKVVLVYMRFCSTWISWISWIRWCIGRSPWSTNRTEKLLSLSSSCPPPWRWGGSNSQHVSTCLTPLLFVLENYHFDLILWETTCFFADLSIGNLNMLHALHALLVKGLSWLQQFFQLNLSCPDWASWTGC